MSYYKTMDEARLVISDIVKVKQGEAVALMTDSQRRGEAEALALAAHEAGGDVIIEDISQHVGKILSGPGYWSDPPKHVIATIQNSDVTILTVHQTYGFRLAHKIRFFVKVSESCQPFKLDPGMGTWGLTRDDIDRIMETCKKIMDSVNGHQEVHITSPRGTDVKLVVKNRLCKPVFPIMERGKTPVHGIPLWGELNWAPVEDQTEGKVVIDGITEANPAKRVVSEPVEWTVKKGKIVEVRGGEDADDFRRVTRTDEGSMVIGELGMGGSHKALFGTESEKGRLGTVHFGLGNNLNYPGGQNKSGIHVDGSVRRVTIEVDGRVIVQDGNLMI